MMSNETVVPATLIPQIKEALIALGYAHADTPLSFVQDAYFKYVMIKQTGFNPNVPYALGLLPQSIQDQLIATPGAYSLVLPSSAVVKSILNSVLGGALPISGVQLVAVGDYYTNAQVDYQASGNTLTYVLDASITGEATYNEPDSYSLGKSVIRPLLVVGMTPEMILEYKDGSVDFAFYGVDYYDGQTEVYTKGVGGMINKLYIIEDKVYFIDSFNMVNLATENFIVGTETSPVASFNQTVVM